MEEIVNKVAASALEVFDLEDYYVPGRRVSLDISQWLYEGLLLREKEFRQSLKDHDWTQYQDAFVAVTCNADAIVPAWASILVAVHLAPFAKKVVSGSLDDLETILYAEKLQDLDYSAYTDKPIILKGCSKKPVPQSAYLLAVKQLQAVAKSVMYGEACSAVPLFKRK
ncbi:DUF2480 family protein [Flavobacterium silvaticum]|uniref:DUF2480 family protein n=1 Tax=Flavobacterium silvaticum TaxID=1852020 RepID=A0A972G109_9FLAO|nr:DUF2480 family protein [Flavobacterium silvaticum]NMH28461.1 DUF2480 family protein [Flavobacterium silvaticum]